MKPRLTLEEKKQRKSESHRRYVEANREKVNKRRREWCAENRDAVNATTQKWVDANREAVNVTKRAWYAANREEIAVRARQAWPEYYAAHGEQLRARQAMLYATDLSYRQRLAVKNTRRRSSETDGHTLAQLHEHWRTNEIDPKHCTYCDAYYPKWKTSIGDHVIPLGRGGTDVMHNLVPACISCNIRKGDRILHVEWTPPNMRLGNVS